VVPTWGLIPELDWLQTTFQVLVAGMALALAFVPRRRTLAQLAALAGALLIATQLAATNWAPNYTVWFAPVALAAIFTQTREGPPSVAAPRPKAEKGAVA
jgi:peptidoglycan/LPS O-acetylase OafA/YrhL